MSEKEDSEKCLSNEQLCEYRDIKLNCDLRKLGISVNRAVKAKEALERFGESEEGIAVMPVVAKGIVRAREFWETAKKVCGQCEIRGDCYSFFVNAGWEGPIIDVTRERVQAQNFHPSAGGKVIPLEFGKEKF